MIRNDHSLTRVNKWLSRYRFRLGIEGLLVRDAKVTMLCPWARRCNRFLATCSTKVSMGFVD